MVRTSGHVKLRKGKRGSVWYLKYRPPHGKQTHVRLGLNWTGRGRPPAGYYTRRMAEEALQEVLTDARRGELDAPVSTGATFADASAEWLRHAAQERACKASTLTDYRLAVRRLDEFLGTFTLEDISTTTIERWRDEWIARESPSNRTVQKYLVIVGSIFRHAKRRYGLRTNPMDEVERPRVRNKVEIDVLSPEEVWALVRAAELGAGRGDLPDRRLHRTPPGRAARVALARRRLRAPRRSRPSDLQERQRRRHPEVRAGEGGANGRRSRSGPSAA